MAMISCARCGARNRTPEDRNLRLRCAQCKTELPNEFINRQLTTSRDQLRELLAVMPKVSTASQLREVEATYERVLVILGNLVELPLHKSNPEIYSGLVRECDHLAREVQIVMTGSVAR
jgi:hypothetical protein